jgi:hypothetical protein
LILCLAPTAACDSSSDSDDPSAGDGSATGDVAGPDGSTSEGGAAGGEDTGGGDGGDTGAAGSSGGDGDGAATGAGGSSASGTAGSGGDPGASITVPLDELPGAFATAVCDALEDCIGSSALRELMRREDCDARLGAELEASDFAYLGMAVDAGGILYDPTKLAACQAGIREMGCSVLRDSFPQPCVDVLVGNVQPGEECAISAECAGTAFCAGADSCPSTCTELLEEGATCDADSQCADGLRCVVDVCGAPSANGEDCGGDSGKVCELGLSCSGGGETEVGNCVPNAQVQVGDAGDVCEPGGDLCQDGLSCVFDGATGFVCEGTVERDGACHLGLPSQCPADQYCDTTEVTEESNCADLPGDGEACVLSGLCAGGHACVVEDGSPVCRALQDNGGSCGSAAQCRSGFCEGGECVPPPTCL